MGAIGLPGFGHIVWFGALVPWLAVRSLHRFAAMPLPPRRRFYWSVMVQQAGFLAFSLFVARREGLALFPNPGPGASDWLVAGGFLALALAVLAPEWRRRIRIRDRRVLLASPMDPTEHLLWAGVSALAGASEEITYRGVLYLLFAGITGSPAAAAGLSALAFAMGHAVQGWRAAAIVFWVAAGFQGLVMVTGSLLPAMVVHWLYDTIAGFTYGWLARRHGFTEAPPPAPEPA